MQTATFCFSPDDLDVYQYPFLYEDAMMEVAEALYEMNWDTSTTNEVVINGETLKVRLAAKDDYRIVIGNREYRHTWCENVFDLAHAVLVSYRGMHPVWRPLS
jgi:hypothetical protein